MSSKSPRSKGKSLELTDSSHAHENRDSRELNDSDNAQNSLDSLDSLDPSGSPDSDDSQSNRPRSLAEIDPKGALYCVQKTNLPLHGIAETLKLLFVEDCTVPFIARYRKERTKELDETQIRLIQETYEEYVALEKRRAFILDTLKKQEKLTPELEKAILKAQELTVLEDIYAPFKSQRKTKATVAKEQGLEPLAKFLLDPTLSLEKIKKELILPFFGSDKEVKTMEDALKGASHIIVEEFSHHPATKETLRDLYWKEALLTSTLNSKAEEQKDYLNYKDYFDFNTPISTLKESKASHRFLAIRRGMNAKILKVQVTFETEKAYRLLEESFFAKIKDSAQKEFLQKCARMAQDLYIHPSLELEIKSSLKQVADEGAIDVFTANLRNLLLAPYLGSKTVMGVDPGVRTGCKIAIVDETGKFLVDFVIYPHPPQNETQASKQLIEIALNQFKVGHIAIGNGTYGRETLAFLEEHVEAIKNGDVKATLISEAGASVYSASPLAKEEFPNHDVTVRGAISIARRFQDPLAELVKIDPKSIGVGQYQHDVNQSKLKKSLESTVESCVNHVGVDLNTASVPLLSYVSGINKSLAKKIVSYRQENGEFKSRQELLKIGQFSDKVFEQSAGFLRIYNGENPLDATFIHPERYPILAAWAKKKNHALASLRQNAEMAMELEKDRELSEQIGSATLKDIVTSLRAPSQDPRTIFQSVDYDKSLKDFKDLKVGKWYTGVVSNITQFGAFIDLGIKEKGLLHISEFSHTFVENPLEFLKVGEEVKVRVVNLESERKRIGLSLKAEKAQGQGQSQHQGQNGAFMNVSSDRAPRAHGTHGGGTRERGGHSSHSQSPSQSNHHNHKKDKQPGFRNNAFAKLGDFKVK